jgi:acyl-coenzyme A thioesterase PaaI-like protein
MGSTCGKSTVATLQQISEFMAESFPQSKVSIEAVDAVSATVRHEIGIEELRPGGTVAGPVLMAVADAALYVAIFGRLGIIPLAVTTSLTVNFLRKPASGRDIVGVCKLMKSGRSLAVGEVWLYSAGSDEPVAHAVGTYALPR